MSNIKIYLNSNTLLLPLQSKTTEKARQLQAVWQNNDSVANDYRFVARRRCGFYRSSDFLELVKKSNVPKWNATTI